MVFGNLGRDMNEFNRIHDHVRLYDHIQHVGLHFQVSGIFPGYSP